MAKGEKKKSKIWVVIVVLVIIGIAASSGDSENKDENPKKVSSSSGEQGKNKGADETESVQTEFVKGDVLETEDLRVSYLNSGEYKDYNEFLPPADGNKIVFIELEFENISETDQYVSSFEFSCYADGYDCETYLGADEEMLDATLSPGKKTKGMVMFEVPSDAKEIQVEYEVNFWTEDKIVFVVE